jgi:two-component system chemotaxis response regulator CheY
MSLNLLLVEDSAVMRTMIRRCLSLSQIDIGQVAEAANGQEGLAALATHRPDVVLADINMPVMDGEEMISRMRDNPAYRQIPVVVISTEGSQTRIARLENQGVTFVHKPFRPETIREALLSVMSKHTIENTASTLLRVAQRTLEDLAFVFPVDDDAPQNLAAAPALEIAAAVKFDGPMSGRLVLSTTRDSLSAIAANMLGLMEEERAELDEQADALMELVTIICGALLPALAGHGPVFSLHSQEFFQTNVEQAFLGGPPEAASVNLPLASGPVRITVCFE